MNHRVEGIWTETPMTFGTFMVHSQNKPLNLTWLSYFNIKAWSESKQHFCNGLKKMQDRRGSEGESEK